MTEPLWNPEYEQDLVPAPMRGVEQPPEPEPPLSDPDTLPFDKRHVLLKANEGDDVDDSRDPGGPTARGGITAMAARDLLSRDDIMRKYKLEGVMRTPQDRYKLGEEGIEKFTDAYMEKMTGVDPADFWDDIAESEYPVAAKWGVVQELNHMSPAGALETIRAALPGIRFTGNTRTDFPKAMKALASLDKKSFGAFSRLADRYWDRRQNTEKNAPFYKGHVNRLKRVLAQDKKLQKRNNPWVDSGPRKDRPSFSQANAPKPVRLH